MKDKTIAYIERLKKEEKDLLKIVGEFIYDKEVLFHKLKIELFNDVISKLNNIPCSFEISCVLVIPEKILGTRPFKEIASIIINRELNKYLDLEISTDKKYPHHIEALTDILNYLRFSQ